MKCSGEDAVIAVAEDGGKPLLEYPKGVNSYGAVTQWKKILRNDCGKCKKCIQYSYRRKR